MKAQVFQFVFQESNELATEINNACVRAGKIFGQGEGVEGALGIFSETIYAEQYTKEIDQGKPEDLVALMDPKTGEIVVLRERADDAADPAKAA